MDVFKQYALQILIAVISGAIIPTVVTALTMRGKNKADAASVLTGSALKMVDELQEEMKSLREQVSLLSGKVLQTQRELFEKEQRIQILEHQVAEKDSRIQELQSDVAIRDSRIDGLEKRIKELEEAERKHEQSNGHKKTGTS